MRNKRGMELAISTIVLIVLGIMVLIALLLILTGQGKYFTDFLDNIRGRSSVDAAVKACNFNVLNQQSYSYCCEDKVVKVAGEDTEITCDELRLESFGEDVEVLDCEEVSC